MLRLTPPPSRLHILHPGPLHNPYSPMPTPLHFLSPNPQSLSRFLLSPQSSASSSTQGPPHLLPLPPAIRRFTQPTASYSSSHSPHSPYSPSPSPQTLLTLTKPTALLIFILSPQPLLILTQPTALPSFSPIPQPLPNLGLSPQTPLTSLSPQSSAASVSALTQLSPNCHTLLSQPSK